MNPANQRSALGALDTARPIIARLDIGRDAEDVAADLIDAWNYVETALRALLGGSSLTGQALIRELRQREVLSLDQGHSLLEFLATRDRANRPSYRPTSADISAAREGFQKIEDAVMGPPVLVPPTAAGAVPLGTPPVAGAVGSATADATAARGRRVSAGAIVLGVLLLVVLGAGAFLAFARSGGATGAVRQAVEDYTGGRRERARSEFEKIARDNPDLVEPHLYLGRMAREEGDYPTALRELQTAIRRAPNNQVAQREMAAYLFATGQYELARRFYIRAAQLNPQDKNALGYLGCTLVRLGRYDEGNRFLARAGTGSWSACAQQLPPPRPLPSR